MRQWNRTKSPSQLSWEALQNRPGSRRKADKSWTPWFQSLHLLNRFINWNPQSKKPLDSQGLLTKLCFISGKDGLIWIFPSVGNFAPDPRCLILSPKGGWKGGTPSPFLVYSDPGHMIGLSLCSYLTTRNNMEPFVDKLWPVWEGESEITLGTSVFISNCTGRRRASTWSDPSGTSPHLLAFLTFPIHGSSKLVKIYQIFMKV